MKISSYKHIAPKLSTWTAFCNFEWISTHQCGVNVITWTHQNYIREVFKILYGKLGNTVFTVWMLRNYDLGAIRTMFQRRKMENMIQQFMKLLLIQSAISRCDFSILLACTLHLGEAITGELQYVDGSSDFGDLCLLLVTQL